MIPRYQANKRSLQSGITVLELLVAITLIGTLTLVILNRHAVNDNRERVAEAVYEANLLRRGLTNFTVDYSHFPTNEREVVLDLVTDVRDDRGRLLMMPVFGHAFDSFRYIPIEDGKTYRIEVTARDRQRTKIITTPTGTRLERGTLASRLLCYLRN